ncbi:glutamine synthetase [Alicyclobacillus hesperidum]|uniref:Glutamine synthetase n=2 Tax=Alicyclobacillus hesperidum TaxID=89784 RepID=A0A1H2R4D2_9BACL|nr:glutamine synthetase family protein [Alicyclobacillus hesperidum]GLV13199.1 glutamine synthetase [Alicyclobacillus hesperidum]SDW14000.1 glutamine synthetase [Alicyclobacillus hesperidum]
MKRQTTADDLTSLAQAAGVRFVRLQFADLFGTVKTVEIPVASLAQACTEGVLFDGSSIHGFARVEESDMYLCPDTGTWVLLPWLDETGRPLARMICDIKLPDGSPFAGDPRAILKRAVADAQACGFETLSLASELEFFLFPLDNDSQPVLVVDDRAGYFGNDQEQAAARCRLDMANALAKLGIPLFGTHHETAPCQHEIDIAPLPVVQAADALVTAKIAMRTVAREHGLYVSWMPKPFASFAGSGLHVRFQAKRAGMDDFRDVLCDGTVGCGSSFIAGLIDHAAALTAIANPLVNSYKRLQPGSEAPIYAFWSTRHPMPFVRAAMDANGAVSIELRSPDPSCNPYLAFAAAIAAGTDGVRRRLTAPPALFQSATAMTAEERFLRSIPRLPINLEDALAFLEEDETIRACLGEHAVTHYVGAKAAEWEAYSRTVHAWEHEQYL